MTGSADNTQGLKRVLRTRDLVIFGLIFISPNSAQSLFGGLTVTSGGHGVLSIFVGLVAMIFTALSYGKMASIVPKAGSTYSYAAHSLNPSFGFIAGWAILLDYLIFPMLVFKLSSLFAIELLTFIPLWLMLLIVMVPMTYFNFLGTKMSARLNAFMLVLKLGSVFLFVGFAIYYLFYFDGVSGVVNFKGVLDTETFSMNSLIAGTSIAVLSYIGFDAITALSEDAKVDGKAVGRAAIITCFISAVLIGAQVYFATLIQHKMEAFKSVDTAFYEIATTIGGSGLAAATTIILVLTAAATALAGQASGSRVLFSMGRDKVMPAFLSYLHPKHKTPVYSILILAVLGYFGALLIPMKVFFVIVVFGALVGFLFVNVSVIIEFYVKRKERKGMGFFSNFLSPLLGILVCLYILVGMESIGQVVGISWLALGVLVLAIKTKGFQKQFSGLSLE